MLRVAVGSFEAQSENFQYRRPNYFKLKYETEKVMSWAKGAKKL